MCRRLAGSALAALTLLSAPSLGSGVRQLADLGRPGLRVVTDRDGLPQNSVLSMAFDTRGYLWVGTLEGAAAFNGRTWSRVRLPGGGRSNEVRAVAAGKDGAVWLGTGGAGLFRLADGRLTNWKTAEGLPSEDVASLLQVREGAEGLVTWVGTMGGLCRLDGERIARVEGMTDPVLALAGGRADDGQSVVWAGFKGAVGRVAGSRVERIPLPAPYAEAFVRALLETTDGEGARVLWVGTERGLLRRRAGAWLPFDRGDGPPVDIVRGLLETVEPDGGRTLWAGTYGSGVARFSGGRWEVLDSSSGLPTSGIVALAQTPRPPARSVPWRPPALPEAPGSIWLGTVGGGLVQLNPGGWRTIDTRVGLPGNTVYAQLQSAGPAGRSHWVGTFGGGFAEFRDGAWHPVTRASGMPAGDVWALAQAAGPDGTPTVWAGTNGGGLAYRRDGLWHAVDRRAGLPADVVFTAIATPEADGVLGLWVGTHGGGVARVVRGRVTAVYRKGSGLPSDEVNALLETSEPGGPRTLWVGTADGGLARLRDGRWTVEGTESGLPANGLYCVSVIASPEGKRTLWVGTDGGGAAYRDLSVERGGWTVVSDATTPALPSGVVYQVLPDAHGRLYLTTNKGVARLTPRPESGRGIPFDVETFTTDDGLPSNECNGGASIVDGEGRLWIGTVGGIGVLDPARNLEDRAPKPLYVEEVRVNGERRRLLPGDVLGYQERNLVFSYALVSFFRPTDTRYQTQLVGLEESPTPWSDDSKREYTTLPAGSYVFRVWGRDYAGNVSGPVSLPFEVRRAPWRTWWAFLAYGAAAVAAAVGLGRWRLSALKRQNQELEARVDERTVALARKVEQLKASEATLNERTRELAETVFQLQASEARALEARREAQEASQAKSVFLAGVSHELRTPLNAIIGYSEILQEEAEGLANPRIAADLAKIQAAGQHLLQLINGVLDLSKIEAGKMDLVAEPVDVASFVADVVGLCRPLIERARNALWVEVAQDAGTMVVDPTKLRQSLFNVLSNAAKFTDRGRIELKVGAGELAGAPAVVFTLADTGIGITEEERQRLFAPFTQADPSTSRRYGGTGLGLALTRRFCELMGGEIELTSSPGEGTVVVLRIPREPPVAAPAGGS